MGPLIVSPVVNWISRQGSLEYELRPGLLDDV
jgi:hypothetical protein